MLYLYFNAPVTDPNVYYIDDSFNLAKKPEWFNEMAIRLIEEIDGNKHIKDGVSDSPRLGVISPGELSGGIKTLIYAMNRPETVCPLQWLGQNMSDILVDVSNAYDVSFTYPGGHFKFSNDQKMILPEYGNCLLNGQSEFVEALKRFNLYEIIDRGFKVDFDRVSNDTYQNYANN